MERIDHTRQRPRRAAAGGRRTVKLALGDRERRRLVQLAVCLVLFLVVFLGKGLLPQRLSGLREDLSHLLAGDTDFSAVFADLGRAFSQGEPVLGALDGLLPEESETPQPKALSAPLFDAQRQRLLQPISATGALAMNFDLPDPSPASTLPPSQPSASDQPAAAEPPAPTETPQSAVIHVDYLGPPLPEGATMDKYLLGLTETISPIQGAEGWWVSSFFGWRDHPVDGEEKFHNGVDLAVNTGTEVKAFAAGTVDFIGESDIYGLYVQLRHAEGVTSFYAHCSELLVQKGQSVSLGEVIARSGGTGNATGPHLHFELKKDGLLLNPLYYMEDQHASGEA